MKNQSLSPVVGGVYRFLYRLACGYFWLRRPLTLGVKALIQDSEGRILLVKHSYQWGWHLPGGGVKKGENVYEAIARELKEEVCLECPQESLLLRGICYSRGDHKHDHVAIFVVRNCDIGTVRPGSSEIEELQFFDELPASVWPGTRRRVSELRCAAPVSEWW